MHLGFYYIGTKARAVLLGAAFQDTPMLRLEQGPPKDSFGPASQLFSLSPCFPLQWWLLDVSLPSGAQLQQ